MSQVGAARKAFGDLSVGRTVTVRKTVSEADICLFAGVSGDFHPNHIDEQYMQSSRYGRRIAHGALLVAYMSAASTKMILDLPGTIVSYGYDRIRFVRPAFIGDTIAVRYEIVRHDVSSGKAFASVSCTNQRNELVAAAIHILKLVDE